MTTLPPTQTRDVFSEKPRHRFGDFKKLVKSRVTEWKVWNFLDTDLADMVKRPTSQANQPRRSS